MTQTFGTNENNDLYLGPDGNLVVLVGQPAVAAACKTAAYTQKGECVLDIQRGLPNFQAIWVGNPDIAQFEAALQATLAAVDGVLRVIGITTQLNNGTLTYSALILTQYGQTEIGGFFNVA